MINSFNDCTKLIQSIVLAIVIIIIIIIVSLQLHDNNQRQQRSSSPSEDGMCIVYITLAVFVRHNKHLPWHRAKLQLSPNTCNRSTILVLEKYCFFLFPCFIIPSFSHTFILLLLLSHSLILSYLHSFILLQFSLLEVVGRSAIRGILHVHSLRDEVSHQRYEWVLS